KDRSIKKSAIPTEFSEVSKEPSRLPEKESLRGSNSSSFVPDLESIEQNSVEGSQKILSTGISVGIAVKKSMHRFTRNKVQKKRGGG
ncbi:MAG: hypothetical protein KDK40_02605, partial [Chlamydiia bacterium]|nr:hypothetical protein [Chlamydiia bacterium]